MTIKRHLHPHTPLPPQTQMSEFILGTNPIYLLSSLTAESQGKNILRNFYHLLHIKEILYFSIKAQITIYYYFGTSPGISKCPATSQTNWLDLAYTLLKYFL